MNWMRNPFLRAGVLALSLCLLLSCAASCQKTPPPTPPLRALTLQDFAEQFVTALDSWFDHTGTVDTGSGGQLEAVHVVPGDFSFQLGDLTYDKAAAFDVAVQGFESLMEGYSLDINIPTPRDYAWPEEAYGEPVAFGAESVSQAFLADYLSRQQAVAGTGGLWAGNLGYQAEMLQEAGYVGDCCLERGLLILVRWYRQLLRMGLEQDADVALAAWPLSADLYGGKLAVHVPYSQFYKETFSALGEARDAGVLTLKLKGEARIASVHLSGGADASSLSDDGMSFVNLNCNREAPLLTAAGETAFSLVLNPGTYDLAVTVCDREHRAMFLQLDACVIEAGGETVVSKDYAPAEELLFYEGFDNFVWGGDYVGGEGAPGFAPDQEPVTITSRKEATGYETQLLPVAYDVPGAGFFQSNTWADVNGKTVGTSHQLSDSYVESRNLSEYVYLFRSQERPGYLELGCANTARGAIRLWGLPRQTGIGDVTISFDVCPKYGLTDDVEIMLVNGGRFTGVTVDGTARTLDADNTYYRASTGYHMLGKAFLALPASASAAKQWTHVELTATNVTDGSLLQIQGSTTASGNHGLYFDNFMIVKNGELPRKTLRLLYWNIQNGMWADQADQYANFVEWVRKYDPDVCVWCEAKSNYKTNSDAGVGSAAYLPNNWGTLARRYGHDYTAIGGFRDNFPQVVTAKYPIETLQKITDGLEPYRPVAHGAGHHRITVGGREIDLVTLHTWPQAYAYGVNGDAEREESKSRHEGDYYRQYEMESVVAKTVNDSRYADRQYWLMMGDFNSRSRLDNWFYKYDEASTLLITQDVLLEKTNLVDIIAYWYPGDMVASTQGNARIDYVYASPEMYKSVSHATILIDKWTTAYNTGISTFWSPSDHRPILVDFDY